MSIRKRTLPSGKAVWQVDYRDQAGARRHKQFSTKRDATAWLDGAKGEIRAGTHVAETASITVAEAADLWIVRAQKNDRETSTVRQYRTHAEQHIKPFLGATKLTALTAPAVQRFADDLAETRSRAMVGKVLTSLSGILAEAQARGLIGRNVARDVRIRLPKRDKARPEMPSTEELRAIIAHAKGRWRPFVITAIFTGLRASELRGLRWADVDLKTKVLTVSGRVDAWGIYGAPKSDAGTRDVPLAPLVVNALKEWKLVCPKPPEGMPALVFPNGSGKPESHANILNRGFWPLQVTAGITRARKTKDAAGKAIEIAEAKYSLHALRHAAAALFIQQGFTFKKVQVIMGHASIQMTYDVYGYLLDRAEDDGEAMAQMQARLLG